MLQSTIFEFKLGENRVKLETGLMARQSTSCVIASMDDTVILVTIVCNNEIKLDQKFFPLSVHYQEKFYSGGRIPGSFFRREGRSSDNEIILSRLIDRAIRPLFNMEILNEVQIVINLISLDPQVSTDVISIIGVSAALGISGLPLNCLGACRVGLVDHKYIINPSLSDINLSKLNLVIAGTKDGILMIDACCDSLNENEVYKAINFGYKNIRYVIDNINIFCDKYYNNKFFKFKSISVTNSLLSKDILSRIYKYKKFFEEIYNVYLDKFDRLKKIQKIIHDIYKELSDNSYVFPEYLVLHEISKIERDILIAKLIKTQKRIDGRLKNSVRDIDIRIGLLPKRVHGSALFTRGETQALVTVTLGTYKDAQSFDDLFGGERLDKFIFHYNFPPYSVGEIGNIGIPKRREIGHGYLAKKGIIPIMPNVDKFPYTIRIVSDILESNGSSSMASVCGASLALMDAGVSIKSSVAGIAMGLLKDKNNIFILTDIIGDEDRLGDMDFKVIGTFNGITALQMDMKVKGITCDIIYDSLLKAKEGRLIILEKMNLHISDSKKNISPFAPKIYNIKIDKNQIKDVIGKGGSVIKNLTEKSSAIIEVEDNGFIKVISNNKKNALYVINRIKEITAKVKVGLVYIAKVIKIVNFGVFVSFLGNRHGLVHISQIYNKLKKTKNILNHFKIGQKISVKVLEVCSNTGKIKLTMNI